MIEATKPRKYTHKAKVLGIEGVNSDMEGGQYPRYKGVREGSNTKPQVELWR
jgi:hypothetical protein